MVPRCWFFWAWWLPLIFAVATAELQGEGCSAKTCGNLTISHPFWLTDLETGSSCGSQDFEIACYNNTPVIRCYGLLGFAIINISYEERSLRAIDLGKLDLLNASKSCDVPPNWNTSAKLGPQFGIDPSNLDLIFYNCTEEAAEAAHRDGALVETRMRCGNESDVFARAAGSYNETSDYAGYNIEGCDALVVPVLRSPSGKANASDYVQLVRDGFLLTWGNPTDSANSLRVVDQGKLNILHDSNSCPAWSMNTSIKLGPPFRIDADNMNLVFYNCTRAEAARRDQALVEVRCGGENNMFVRGGVLHDEMGDYAAYAIEGCNATVVPVLGTSGGANASNYEQLINAGFLMTWQQPLGSGSKRTGRKIVLIVLTSAAAALLFPCIYVLIWHRKGKRLWFLLCKKTSSSTERNYEAMIVAHGSLAPRRYMYSELMAITSSRSDQLGRGGYGVVYKGRLHDGRLVAVKFLHDCKGNGDEFVNEVMSIGRTSHVNIVNLFGFCLEGSKRALIYEYMPNGSLDKYIYSEKPKEILGWGRLYAIAIGIARGLEYLHHSCNTRIVHFDIKPQNILLDKDFSPKIADFGLAKLCHTKESKVSMTGTRGTIGFIAPEVHSRTFGVVSTKSDIYSYGMMLLEMVGGRKNVNSVAEKSSQQYFPDWIYDHFAQDDGLQACDVTSEIEEMARKMTFIGLWCVQILPIYRPTIAKVLEMFERSLDEMEMPPKQNFSGLLEDSAHNMSASSTIPEDISLVNSKGVQQ